MVQAGQPWPVAPLGRGTLCSIGLSRYYVLNVGLNCFKCYDGQTKLIGWPNLIGTKFYHWFVMVTKDFIVRRKPMDIIV